MCSLAVFMLTCTCQYARCPNTLQLKHPRQYAVSCSMTVMEQHLSKLGLTALIFRLLISRSLTKL